MPKENKENNLKALIDAATEKGSHEIDAMLGAYMCLCTLNRAARIRVLGWLRDALADYCTIADEEPPF